MELSRETLQNLSYFWNKKTKILGFFVFHFKQLWICNGGCRHRPGQSKIAQMKKAK